MLALAQSLVAARLLLLAAALGNWVLSEAATRRRLFIVISLCAAWLVEQCWQQYLFGVNIFGAPRFGDGALTGPFPGLPRAGSAYVLLFFPVALVSAYRLAAWRGRKGQALGGLLAVFMVLTMVLIGQRMPTLLMLFGLVLVAWLLPQGRRPVLLAMAAAALLLAATPMISPPTFQKLVLRLWEQLSNFPASPYGLLYMRAAAILNAHPWLGAGHNAFRTLCGDPAYFHGLPWLGISDSAAGGLEACNNHPHNFYLQAATAGGYPGLLLFVAMAIVIVRTMATSAMRTLPVDNRVVRLALLVQMSVAFWPLASTNDFLSIPNAGWMFLMLGWGLAEAVPTRLPDQGRAATTVMSRLS